MVLPSLLSFWTRFKPPPPPFHPPCSHSPPTSTHCPWDCMRRTTQGSDLLRVSRSRRCLQQTRSSTLETQVVAETTPRLAAGSRISFILAGSKAGAWGELAARQATEARPESTERAVGLAAAEPDDAQWLAAQSIPKCQMPASSVCAGACWGAAK